MERDTNQMSQSSASLCRSGCGFYGNPSADGLCSKCYKDAVKRKQSAPSPQLSQSSSASVSHSNAGRNSPISVPIMDSSANLPLLTTFENSLNTASPTVPSAIIASAQDLITKLEKRMTGKRKKKESKESDSKKTKNSVDSTKSSNESNHKQTQTTSDSNSDLCVTQSETSSTGSQSLETQKLNSSANQESSNQSNAVNTSEKDCKKESPQTPQTDSNGSDQPKTSKKKKNRCTKCKVNVGVIGFPCRCGGTFCSTHRYANEHDCTFDYREHGAEEIRKNNPQVIGEKVTKI